MYGYLSCGISLLLCQYFLPCIWCLNNETITWPENPSGVRFTGMLLSKYGGHIIVSGTNILYNINASNLELLNSGTTGPYNASTDDTVRLMIYNQTYSGPEYVTTCSNTHNYCSIRKLDDVTDVEWQLQKPVRDITGVQAFIVDSFHGSKHDSYLFVGCPHWKNQDKQEGLCRAPGIFWYKNSGNEENDGADNQAFKIDSYVKTVKFVAAFPMEKMRIFFSVQSQVDGPPISRVAQVCQYYDGLFDRYTTPFTYVDMPMQCGGFREIFDVKKVSVDNTTLLVAVFTENRKTAICVYNMSHVNETFADNMKICYTEPVIPNSDTYYFRYAVGLEPCRDILPSTGELPQTVEEYLCNPLGNPSYHHMIGSLALVQTPVILFNETTTAVTIATENSTVIAFVGTSYGTIQKATVYPDDLAGIITQPYMFNYGNIIDMLTSRNEDHVFVLTDYKVYKTPVESCSFFKSCGDCMGSNDPYCGWCMLENRCSKHSTCNASYVWISALGTNHCPSVRDIQPDLVSDREIDKLSINVSHTLQASTVKCVFDNELFATRNHTVPANISSDGYTVECEPDFIAEEFDAIKGIINISIYITTPMSTSPIMTGYFRVYNCETLYSCYQCTDMTLSCIWDTYRARCVYNTSSINSQAQLVKQQDMCPRAQTYTVHARTDESTLESVNGSWYLSKYGMYNLTMTGTNLPDEMEAVGFSCNMSIGSRQIAKLIGIRIQPNQVTCELKWEADLVVGHKGEVDVTIQVMWRNSEIAGEPFQGVIYECERLSEASDNCGLCQSFVTRQPYYRCQWCESSCIYSQKFCNETTVHCPDPVITNVYPMSVSVNASLQVEIEGKNLGSVFNDTIDAVTIVGKPCRSIEELYDPGRRIVCTLDRSTVPRDGKVRISLTNNATGEYPELFSVRLPVVSAIVPTIGPNDGGTLVTISGTDLDTGSERKIFVDQKRCLQSEDVSERDASGSLVCKTQSLDNVGGNTNVTVRVEFDGAMINGEDDVYFTYVTNPRITNISPLNSFASGGRNLTVLGSNLHVIQKPKIYAVVGGIRSIYENCIRSGSESLICPSPRYEEYKSSDHHRVRRQLNTGKQARLGFIMDDVSSVLADNLTQDIAGIIYYPDPVIYNLTKTKQLMELKDDNLIIKGNNLALAASIKDVKVMIGCFMCNITEFTSETILCKPPQHIPLCQNQDNGLTVKVHIGYYTRSIGEIKYKSLRGIRRPIEQYIIPSVMGLLVICLVVAGVYVGIVMKKKRTMKREIVIKLDKLEAHFRNQCREEFANLQTAVSDLTTDLEGGHVLFREYNMYADKTLFTSEKTVPLRHPPSDCSEQMEKAMDMFKGLLRNTQFLIMFIKTLEKQSSFTIHDKSNVATILMTLNHDNMEYITGILLSLLGDLVDKNVDSGTPKLMLRRSESVAEKLLTHWLSICMYHDLKGKTGSALYILYKAIKIQTEKGPIDYITNCGKYTLSEDKLFTFGDRDITPVTLSLEVNHFDYNDDQEKQVTVNVLDCDTITQAKSKILDIFYKNVPYSQRPSVHSTTLAVESNLFEINFFEDVEEDDGGTKRLLHDEDASSLKEGGWKRINTLQHYNIQTGAVVHLYLNREMEESCKSLGDVSPEAYIVGTLRKSKPAVKTISDSNFWHLTKKPQSDGDGAPASDLFLPRLTTTKMTIQPYIEQLFVALSSVEDEPSIIIKYLFDFLDMAASRCGVTDPDVVHTWKCNSLLLRFWVNVIKNPEIVFDVHKPLLVDSCLSVVAQTLMDSCSTADLALSKNSPSNKLLFAKDIPRYKQMVRDYFQAMKEKPAVSDQDLNSYLTQKVSQKFSGMFYTQSALMELYSYAVTYKSQLFEEMSDFEESSPGSFTHLGSKLQHIFTCMENK